MIQCCGSSVQPLTWICQCISELAQHSLPRRWQSDPQHPWSHRFWDGHWFCPRGPLSCCSSSKLSSGAHPHTLGLADHIPAFSHTVPPGHDATLPTHLWPQLWNLGIRGLLRKRCWPPAAILHFCDQIKDFVISKRHLDETTTNLYTCDVPEQGAYMAGTPQLPPHTCTRTLYIYGMMVSWSISHDHHL